jgi:hypothetical protein
MQMKMYKPIRSVETLTDCPTSDVGLSSKCRQSPQESANIDMQVSKNRNFISEDDAHEAHVIQSA